MRKDILIGRPEGQFGFPVAIYNPHLAKLQYRLSKLDCKLDEAKKLFPKEDAFWLTSANFLQAQIKDYTSETHRWLAAKPYFQELASVVGVDQYSIHRTAKNSTAKAHMVNVTKAGGMEVPHLIGETKNVFGVGGQPVLQAVRYQLEVLQ